MKAHDGLFDNVWMNELSYQLAFQQSWFMKNIANGHTYPYQHTGTHRLLGVRYFTKKPKDNNVYRDKNVIEDLYDKLIGAFDYYTQRLGYPKMELLEIGLNLQFQGQDGTDHCDGVEGQSAFVLMLSNEPMGEDTGGEFYHKPSDTLVPFKSGRLIEFNAEDWHHGKAFNVPQVARFSIKWLGQPLQIT